MAKNPTPTFIEGRILLLRGNKVLIDKDLAILYQVETRRLNEQVKRNRERFPEDFMFQLNQKEFEIWMSQIAMSNSERMAIRRRPYAFPQNGVAMLSSVLNSARAIQVNIQIMRTFTKMHQIMQQRDDLRKKITALEKKYDRQFVVVFDAIRQILEAPAKSTKSIGF